MPATSPIVVILYTDQAPLWLPMPPRGRIFNTASCAGSLVPVGLHASIDMSAPSVVAHTHSPTVTKQRLVRAQEA